MFGEHIPPENILLRNPVRNSKTVDDKIEMLGREFGYKQNSDPDLIRHLNMS
jgi:hypothetical protein